MSNQHKQSASKQLQSIRDWMADYASSVGKGADFCADLLETLLKTSLLENQARDDLLALLKLMSRLSPDPNTLGCTLLFVATEYDADFDPEGLKLPDSVGDQLSELLKLKQMESEHVPHSASHSAEGLRRLLLALVTDVRVVLIALAWQLVKLRSAEPDSDEAVNIAREVNLIHAPLANRLGVWQLKWELEDLAFRYLEPDQYRRIAELVAERRTDREAFIDDFLKRLGGALEQANIHGEVKGRPKHIYSIWRKMKRKGLDFHELFDVRAVRVLVNDLAACYSVLGLVHTLWQPIPGEFDDYITTPKGNNYQSLHTAVVGPEGKAVEVQIRTFQMHEHAELGVAAHWRYKEGGPNDPAFDNKIAVMRQLMDSADDDLDDQSLLDSFQSATSEDRVYILTPKGQVIDLQQGSTVLDFAYHVHTEVGHRCRGAKVNGRIVPLTYQLHTGERVEILTGKHPHPSRDWLNPRLGYIRGARARSKVRHWFRQENHEENLRQGREVLEAELKRLDLSSAELEPVVARFSLGRIDDLYVAVGNGDLTAGQVAHALERIKAEKNQPKAEDLVTHSPVRKRTVRRPKGDDLVIEGVGNLMTTMARCCQPIPGDRVVGYITRGRGVTIHKEDCSQALRWQQEKNPRLLKVDWGVKPSEVYNVQLQIDAVNRRELIKDISSVLAAGEVSVTDIHSQVDENTDEVAIALTVRIKDYEQLSALLNRLSSIPNIVSARRLSH